jgi:hypothetical protein
VTVQTLPETVVQPAHRSNSEPASGVAVSVTTVAGFVFATEAVQVFPLQVIVAPCARSVPFPSPMLATLSANSAGLNVAVTDLAELIVTVQTFPLNVVQPVQLSNSELPAGVAVSVTTLAGVVFGTSAV